MLAALALLGCGGGRDVANAYPGGAGGEGPGGGAGMLPAGGRPGFAGAPGFAGSGNPVACTFTVGASVSPAIPTVGIVTWSTTLAGLTRAEIRFGLDATGPTMAAPVDLTQPDFRTLLLGMKGAASYLFRIVAWAGDDACTSDDYTLATGPVPGDVPRPKVEFKNPAAHVPGFIVTTDGIVGDRAFILDADGDPVWWAPAPDGSSRANLSWDGTQMYILKLNVQNGAGEVRRVSMDGLTTEPNLSGLATAHHDFTAIPGGIATLLWNTRVMNAPSALVERSTDGVLTVVVADLGTVYNSATFHANAVHYNPTDDSYTVSDRQPSLFVKLTRQGELVWQLGGGNPKDPAKFFTVLDGGWEVNHGHQTLPNGNFLLFTNGPIINGRAMAREYRLDTTAWTATPVWSYVSLDANSMVLGDVQRLRNGNTLVTYSRDGVIHEVGPDGSLVMTMELEQFGYADFRESLYGPPPR